MHNTLEALKPADSNESVDSASPGTATSRFRAAYAHIGALAIRLFSYPNSIFVTMLATYFAFRVGVLRSATLRLWWDTFSYAYREDPAWNPGDLVSLTGHAPRLWGAPALFVLFESDYARSKAQWSITTVAWALLALALWMILRSTATRILASGAVFVFALLTPVTQWDFTILSDSLSISLGVIMVSSFLIWAHTRSRLALAGMIAAGFWWTFVRAEIRLFMVMFGVVLIVVAWRSRALRRGAATAVAAFVIAVAWCSAIVPVTYEHFQPYAHTHIPPEEELLVFKLLYVYGTPEAKQVYEQELGMPPCPGAEEAIKQGFFEMLAEYNKCPELRAWGAEHGADSVNFVLHAPGLFAQQLQDVIPGGFAGVDGYGLYGNVKPILPAFLDRLIFPGGRLGLAILFGLVIGAGVAALATGAFRRCRLPVISGLTLIGAGLISEVVGVALAATEPARYGIQENFAVRIGLLLLAAASFDAYMTRRRLTSNTSET